MIVLINNLFINLLIYFSTKIIILFLNYSFPNDYATTLFNQ